MGTNPPSQPGRPIVSPDGMWYWDGREWKSTISPDRRWRWNGQTWIPNAPARSVGAGAAIAGIVGAFVGVLALVSLVVIVILLTMGNQIANVFSNVVAALNSP